MTRSLGPIDPDLASWNDRMYEAHATPYERGIAGAIERARARAVLRLADVARADAVLEVGCESGRLLERVPPCRRLVGIDISSRALTDARSRLAHREVELYQVDATAGLPFAAGEFDVVMCSEMLEHVEHPERVVAHLRAIAAPSTRVVVSVPIEGPKVAAKRLLDRVGLLQRIAPGVEPQQSEWHVHAFTPAMLRALVEPHFTIVRRARVLFAHDVALLRAR